MDKDAIIATLRAHREELKRAGIAHAALFGSHARGEARADSDIDILIEFAPGRRTGVFAYAGMQIKVSDLFAGKVDVIALNSMREEVLPQVLKDAVYAF
jgi:uncharacterized protein